MRSPNPFLTSSSIGPPPMSLSPPSTPTYALSYSPSSFTSPSFKAFRQARQQPASPSPRRSHTFTANAPSPLRRSIKMMDGSFRNLQNDEADQLAVARVRSAGPATPEKARSKRSSLIRMSSLTRSRSTGVSLYTSACQLTASRRENASQHALDRVRL